MEYSFIGGSMGVVVGEKIWSSCLRMPKKVAVTPGADWTATAVAFAYAAVMYACLIEIFLRRMGFPELIAAVMGGGLYLAGVFLRQRALRRLGESWSIQLDRADGAGTLVRTGPYRLIRQPIYVSAVLELSGVAVAFASGTGGLVVLLIFLPAELARARFEERYLAERFGAEYSGYASEVPAFVPRLRALGRSRGGNR